ncbi:MAG: hypothetical protein ABWW69_05995 [Pyrodictiaceae archaeon]
MPLIDYETAKRIAVLLRPVLDEYSKRPERFDSPDYYPPRSDPREMVARYFIVLVAMDHRLSRPGKPYEARLDGKTYHGADLLYRLGMAKYREDPEFFAPSRLAKITTRDILGWLCVDRVCPPDPERRAALLRDLGLKLEEIYAGSVTELLREARSRLHGPPEEPGLVELLQTFMAYNDPVEKKAMLLAKFLERRGIFTITDPWNKRVPVDNHLARIALRTGIVRLEDNLMKLVTSRRHVDRWLDTLLRITIREAWHVVAFNTGYDDFLLDDILWDMGRRVCVHGSPFCHNCSARYCRGSACILREACLTGLGKLAPIEEHFFLDTWWY